MTTTATGEPVGYRRKAITVTAPALPRQAAALVRDGFQIALIAGHDDGTELRVVYLFTADGDRRAELHVKLNRAYPHVPSLAKLSYPAGRFERELRDLYGIVPDEHPDPAPLVRDGHWPRDWFPMRQDAGPSPERHEDTVRRKDAELPPGGYRMSFGPVHGGVNEPAEFQLTLTGETVRRLDTRLWFIHKGLEKLFEGRDPAAGVQLAERVSGDTAVGHTLAYCLAVEDALGQVVPARAKRLRGILLELERIYNHVNDLGALCQHAGHDVVAMHAHRVREQLLRLNAEVTGHRLLRGAIRPGGTEVHQLPDPERLGELAADVAELVELALGHGVVRDRFAGTAVLTARAASELGIVGFAARASGHAVDARTDHPFLPAGGAAVNRPPRTPEDDADRTGGDVLARFLARAEEIPTSVAMINGLLESLEQPGPPDGDRDTARSGVGFVEGWRGAIAHRVELAENGTLSRVKIVDPSFLNWPALPAAVAGTALADFSLAVRSFGLSSAGNDR